jgi:transcription-repair coupling factor (superfamily II helicase)
MLLYRELDGLTTDKEVADFRLRLEDRFGPLPRETEELLRIVPFRRLASGLGVERVVLKGERMSLYLVANAESPYYQSKAFGKLIAYMMAHTRRCDLRDQNGKRSILVKNVPDMEEALNVLEEAERLEVDS